VRREDVLSIEDTYMCMYIYVNVYIYMEGVGRYHCVAKGGAERVTKPALERL